jgi:hypothetical protein
MAESEELSKNALKKKLKAEEAAKKKATKDAEKAAKAVDAPKKEKLGGEDEAELDPTQYYENRLRAVNSLGVCKVLISLDRCNIIFCSRTLTLISFILHILLKSTLVNIPPLRMVLMLVILSLQ